MSRKSRIQFGSILVPVWFHWGCKQKLRTLQGKYVITVVGKAAGNFAFTYKKFHFLKLASELGLDNKDQGNESYGFI